MTAAAPLTFGQAHLLNAFRRMPLEHQAERNLVRIWDLPPGVSRDRLHDALRILTERHESLRTRFYLDRDRWWQVIDPVRELPVADCNSARPGRHAGVALEELRHRWFDLRRQPGWYGVVLGARRAAPDQLALCLHHVVTDRYGIDQLERDFYALVGTDRQARLEVLDRLPLRPRELARVQRSGQWGDRRRRSMQHWARMLDVIGQATPAGERTSGRIDLGLRSAVMADALQAVAQRCRVSAQSVLLALTALVVAGISGTRVPVLGLTVANRSDRRWRAIVTAMAQAMLLPVRLDPVSQELPDLARTVHQRALACMRHGTFDPDELAALYTERGWSPPAVDYQFNQLPLSAAAGSYRLPAERVVGLVPRYRVGPRLRVWAFVGSELLIILRSDPRLLPEPAAHQVLHWFRAELASAAERPSRVREMISRLDL